MTQTYNEVYKKFEKILQEIDVNAGKYILLDIVFPTIVTVDNLKASTIDSIS